MAFTSASKVRNIVIWWLNKNEPPTGVNWEYKDGANWVELIKSPSAIHPERTVSAELQTLQQKYANDDLYDDMGNKVIPKINDDTETSLDDFDRMGIMNPLDPQGYQKWQNQLESFGILAQHGEVHHKQPLFNDPDRIELKAGFVPKSYRETGQGRVHLGVWETTVSQTVRRNDDATMFETIFQMQLDIPRSLGITQDTLDNHTPVIGLRSAMNRWKATGAALGTDFTDINSWDNRTFSMTSTVAGRTNFTFEVSRISTSTAAPVTGCWVEGRILTGTYDRELLSTELDRYEVISSGTAEIVTEVDFGDHETPVRTRHLHMSDRASIYERNGVIIHGVRDWSAHTETLVPLGTHRIVDFANLETPNAANPEVKNNPLDYRMPHVGEIHYRGTPAAATFYPTLKLRDPIASTEHSGIVKRLTVDNQSNVRFVIRAWDNTELVQLQANESATVRFISDLEGGGRVIVDAGPRYQIVRGASTGRLYGRGYYDFDTNNFGRLMPPPLHNDNTPVIQHGDNAIEVGPDSGVPNGIQWQNGNNAAYNAWIIRPSKAGRLSFKQDVELILNQNAYGTIPAGHRTALFMKRGSTLITLHDHILNEALTPTFAGRLLQWSWEGDVQEDDLIIPLWIFSKGTSYGGDNISVGLFNRFVELKSNIVKEY